MTFSPIDEYFIRKTYNLAEQAAKNGFDPFGAVLVLNGEMVASTSDKSILYSDPTAHAELVLISEYCRSNRLISLENYTLYCNVEPCVMCSGAIHWARISRVVFGVKQMSLQGVSGGKPKPSCDDLINIGRKKVKVEGPCLELEGIDVLKKYAFLSKKERHIAYWENRD